MACDCIDLAHSRRANGAHRLTASSNLRPASICDQIIWQPFGGGLRSDRLKLLFCLALDHCLRLPSSRPPPHSLFIPALSRSSQFHKSLINTSRGDLLNAPRQAWQHCAAIFPLPILRSIRTTIYSDNTQGYLRPTWVACVTYNHLEFFFAGKPN